MIVEKVTSGKTEIEVDPLGMRPVVVVAHPDDEVLWAGGLIAHYPQKQWTVICCSIPRRDPIRAYKFFDACEVLGVKARVLPFIEPEPSEPLTSVGSIEFAPYSCVVTHNEWGEYGHRQHQSVYAYVKRSVKLPMVTFGYRTGGKGNATLQLTRDELTKKIEALKKYNHITPYEGNNVPKWQALTHRYFEVEKIDPAQESYDF